MKPEFRPGDPVQTTFGKGRVRAVENGGRLVVEVRERTLVVAVADVRRLDRDPVGSRAADHLRARDDGQPSSPVPREVDLHGLVVEEALTRIDQALNDALLAGALELRFIHGRSGGRLRGALHQRLREISSVRHFAIDPRNAGVTIVTF